MYSHSVHSEDAKIKMPCVTENLHDVTLKIAADDDEMSDGGWMMVDGSFDADCVQSCLLPWCMVLKLKPS